MLRSDSDSSLALKRKKADLEELHQNFVSEISNHLHNPEVINNQSENSSAMIIENTSLNNSLSLNNSVDNSSATSSSSNLNTFVYNPKPLFMVNDPKNATLEEINDVFNKNFNLIRDDFNNITNFCKVQQQFSANCYNTINAYSNILKSHQEQIGNLDSKIKTMEVDYSSNLMISGLENIENSNVDLKSMVATLANRLKVNLGKQDIRKVRIVKTPSNTSLVQVTFYSSAHCLRLLDNKKAYGNITNSDVFNYSMSANPIYINELLPQDTHKLLTAARNLKRSFGLFRVWHNRGQIFLQLTPNDRATLINCHKDLEDLSTSLSSEAAQQQLPLQNSQSSNYLQQSQEYYSTLAQSQQQEPPQAPQLQQFQLQTQQQQHLTHTVQPIKKVSSTQFNPHLRPPFNLRQPQAHFSYSHSTQRKQTQSRPHQQYQPSTSTQSNQQYNSNFMNRPRFTQNLNATNRPSKNNYTNLNNKNYPSLPNIQPSSQNYRPPYPTAPQSYSNPPASQQSSILRQPVLQHNSSLNPPLDAPPLTHPPSLSSQLENQNSSQNFNQQCQD